MARSLPVTLRRRELEPSKSKCKITLQSTAGKHLYLPSRLHRKITQELSNWQKRRSVLSCSSSFLYLNSRSRGGHKRSRRLLGTDRAGSVIISLFFFFFTAAAVPFLLLSPFPLRRRRRQQQTKKKGNSHFKII